MSIVFFFVLNIFIVHTFNARVNFTLQPINEHVKDACLTFEIPSGDFIYKDYLTISIDSPDAHISEIQPSSEPQQYYDQTFKETKKVFTYPFSINFQVIHTKSLENSYLHVTYYQRSNKKYITQLFPLSATKKNESKIEKKTCYSINNEINAVVLNALEPTNELLYNQNQIDLLELIDKYTQRPTFKVFILIIMLALILFLSHTTHVMLASACGIIYFCYLLLPIYALLWLIAFFSLCYGLYLLIIPIKKENRHWYMSALGVILIAGSIIGFAKAYSKMYECRLER